MARWCVIQMRTPDLDCHSEGLRTSFWKEIGEATGGLQGDPHADEGSEPPKE